MVKIVHFKITLESALTTQPNKCTTPGTTLISNTTLVQCNTVPMAIFRYYTK